jgi:hypothetical protein
MGIEMLRSDLRPLTTELTAQEVEVWCNAVVDVGATPKRLEV